MPPKKGSKPAVAGTPAKLATPAVKATVSKPPPQSPAKLTDTPAKASTSTAPTPSATPTSSATAAPPANPSTSVTTATPSATAASLVKAPPKEVPTLTRINQHNAALNKKGAAQKAATERETKTADPNAEPSIAAATKAESEAEVAAAGVTGKNPGNAAESNPNFGDGLLNLAEGYEYEEEKICRFLHAVSVRRTEEDVENVAEGILMFIVTENNAMKQKLEQEEVSWQGEKGEKEAEAAANEIRKLSEAQLRGDKRLADTPSIPIPASILRQQGVSMKKSTGQDQGAEVARLLKFDGVDLPMITIYDYLGWLLSRLASSESRTAQRTAKDYYLPLLALYSRWCTIISRLVGFDSLPMVHIAWWGKNVLLGATLGDVPDLPDAPSNPKAAFYKGPRRTMLTNPPELAYKAPEGEAFGRFGNCAETMLFIYAKRKSLAEAFVQGFAMIPPRREDLPKAKAIASGALKDNAKRFDAALAHHRKYQPATLNLRDPCSESCQLLFKQLNIDWKKGFNVRGFWQEKLGTSTTAPSFGSEETSAGVTNDGKDMRDNPAHKGIDDIGEGVDGRPPPDMTAGQILGSTLGVLGQHFGQPLAAAAMHGVLKQK